MYAVMSFVPKKMIVVTLVAGHHHTGCMHIEHVNSNISLSERRAKLYDIHIEKRASWCDMYNEIRASLWDVYTFSHALQTFSVNKPGR